MWKRCFSIHFYFFEAGILNTRVPFHPKSSIIPATLLSSSPVIFTFTSLQSFIHESCPQSYCHPQLFHLCNHKFRHFCLSHQLPGFSTFLLYLLLINLMLHIPEAPVLNSFLSPLHPDLYRAWVLPVYVNVPNSLTSLYFNCLCLPNTYSYINSVL